MPSTVKLSSKITREALLPGDKLVMLRRALDEVDAAQRVTPTTLQAVATAVTPLLGGPNLTPGGPFFVTCRDVNTVGYNDGISILANIADANICFGCTATTHFSPDGPNSVYIASYDVTGPLRINKDGFFGADRNIPARWVLQDSITSARANVRAWTAVINDWKLGEVLTHTIGTVEGFYRTKFAGGPRAAPTGPEDINYKQTAPPIAVAAVFQALTQAEAVLLLDATGTADKVVANRLYRIKMPTEFVYVHGLAAGIFGGRGAVADPANLERGIPVDIDVRAGTVTAAADNVWSFVGPPADGNVALGKPLVAQFLGTYTNNILYGGTRANTFGNNVYACSFGLYFTNNVIGSGHSNNRWGTDCTFNTIGIGCYDGTFGNNVTRTTIGDNCSALIIGTGCTFVSVGNNCTRVEIYNCSGTSAAAPFVIPAGTVGAVYRNNMLVSAGGDTFAVLPYTALGIPLDFNAATVQTLAATGNVSLNTVNRAALKTKQVTITNTTGAAITISYEAWVYFGPAPITSLPAGKKIKLTIQCLGPAIADVEAANVLSA